MDKYSIGGSGSSTKPLHTYEKRLVMSNYKLRLMKEKKPWLMHRLTAKVVRLVVKNQGLSKTQYRKLLYPLLEGALIASFIAGQKVNEREKYGKEITRRFDNRDDNGSSTVR